MTASHIIPESNIIHILQFLPTNKKNKPTNKYITAQLFTQYDYFIKNLYNTIQWINQYSNNNFFTSLHYSWCEYRYEKDWPPFNIKSIKTLVDKLYDTRAIKFNIRFYPIGENVGQSTRFLSISIEELAIVKMHIKEKLQFKKRNKYRRLKRKLNIGLGRCHGYGNSNYLSTCFVLWY